MNNKKAQIGKGLITFPVLLTVVYIVGIFIFLTTAFSSLHPDPVFQPPAPSVSLSSSSPLLQTIDFEVSPGEKTKVLVFDAISLYEPGQEKKQALEESLKQLVDKERPCLVINIAKDALAGSSSAASNFYEYFSLKLKEDGTVTTEDPYDRGPYPEYKELSNIPIIRSIKSDIVMKVRGYSGKCLQ